MLKKGDSIKTLFWAVRCPDLTRCTALKGGLMNSVDSLFKKLKTISVSGWARSEKLG